MLTNLLENRGKEFLNLVKLGDFLGRSLRENVELFNVENGKVTYLTESGHIVNGSFSFKPSLKLSNIKVDKAEILENETEFNKVANTKVAALLSNLLENDFQEADTSFDDILNVFETKLSYTRIKERLSEKSKRFGPKNKIISTKEFQKVVEIKDKIVSMLKENKQISNIPEIKNGLKLASVVSKAFNLPRLTIAELQTSKSYTAPTTIDSSIYEHLCRQELVTKELLEAKENFDSVWANNELINDLASLIYESKNLIEEKVAEIITKIPYFALATKKQLNTLISNSVTLSELDIPNKDLTTFVHTIFEMKKPAKEFVLDLLNEKYGVNVNNLDEVPTFTNLLKTESVILTSLSRLSPKNSVVRQTLADLAKILTEKNGSESIDIVDFLNEIFNSAGYKNVINETSLMQYFDFNQVADDLSKIGTVLKLLRPMMGGAVGGGNQLTPTPPITDPLPQANVNPLAAGDPTANAAQQAATEVMGEEEPTIPGQEPDGDEVEIPGQDPAIGGGIVPGAEGGEDPANPVNIVGGNDIANIVAQIEDLLSGIKGGTGDPVADAQIPGEEDSEFDFNGGEGGGAIPGQENEPEVEDEGSEDQPIPQKKEKDPKKPAKDKKPSKDKSAKDSKPPKK